MQICRMMKNIFCLLCIRSLGILSECIHYTQYVSLILTTCFKRRTVHDVDCTVLLQASLVYFLFKIMLSFMFYNYFEVNRFVDKLGLKFGTTKLQRHSFIIFKFNVKCQSFQNQCSFGFFGLDLNFNKPERQIERRKWQALGLLILCSLIISIINIHNNN